MSSVAQLYELESSLESDAFLVAYDLKLENNWADVSGNYFPSIYLPIALIRSYSTCGGYIYSTVGNWPETNLGVCVSYSYSGRIIRRSIVGCANDSMPGNNITLKS